MCNVRRHLKMIWEAKRVSDMTPQALAWAYSRLSPDRKRHIDSLKREEDRNRSLTGEWLLRQLLCRHWGMEEPVILRTDKGAPVLDNGALHLSITHSEDLVACAVSEDFVGLDTERCKPFRFALLEKVCTEQERQYVLSGSRAEGAVCEDPEIIERFFEIWTGKEAWFKLRGTGILDLKSVNVLQLNRQLHKIDDYLIQIVEL